MSLAGSDATQIRRRSAPRPAPASRLLMVAPIPGANAAALTGPVTQLRVYSARSTAGTVASA